MKKYKLTDECMDIYSGKKLYRIQSLFTMDKFKAGYNFEFKTIYTLSTEVADSKDFRFQVITKDKYNSLVLNLLNNVLIKKVRYEN